MNPVDVDEMLGRSASDGRDMMHFRYCHFGVKTLFGQNFPEYAAPVDVFFIL